MQNNLLFQNRPSQSAKHFTSQKIVFNKQGKISLTKSTKVSSEVSAKNQQINALKSQVLQLKSKLQRQKGESKKMSILSDEIRKVKQKLIEKVNQKNIKQRRNPEQHSDEALSQYFGSSQGKMSSGATSQIQSREPQQINKSKQSTQNIFKNFSIFNSTSKKSQQINGIQMRLIESQQQSKPYDNSYKSNLYRQDTTKNIKDNKQALNRSKFKKNLGSFFQDKTVKNDYHLQQNYINNNPFYYNKFQQDGWTSSKLQQTKKFSIVNYKKKMNK